MLQIESLQNKTNQYKMMALAHACFKQSWTSLISASMALHTNTEMSQQLGFLFTKKKVLRHTAKISRDKTGSLQSKQSGKEVLLESSGKNSSENI